MNREGAKDAKGIPATEDIEALAHRIIGACIEVHRCLGPGLLESAYEACLVHELNLLGISFERQLSLPVIYKGFKVDCGYRMDLVVDGRLVVELKAVEVILPIHEAQLLTYLRLTGCSLGLIANFHARSMKEGLRRMVLNHPE